jgi:hypothetical protein
MNDSLARVLGLANEFLFRRRGMVFRPAMDTLGAANVTRRIEVKRSDSSRSRSRVKVGDRPSSIYVTIRRTSGIDRNYGLVARDGDADQLVKRTHFERLEHFETYWIVSRLPLSRRKRYVVLVILFFWLLFHHQIRFFFRLIPRSTIMMLVGSAWRCELVVEQQYRAVSKRRRTK